MTAQIIKHGQAACAPLQLRYEPIDADVIALLM